MDVCFLGSNPVRGVDLIPGDLSLSHTHTHTQVERLGGGTRCRLLILSPQLSSGSFITGLFRGGQT